MDSQRWDDLKAEVLERTDTEEFARSHLEGVRDAGGGEIKALCLYHDENKPSLHINRDRRVFYCQGCGEKGNLIDLYMRVKSLPFKEALLEMAGALGIDTDQPAPTARTKPPPPPKPPPPSNPPISMRKVKMWHAELRARPERVRWLVLNRGMKRRTLSRYLIGWDGQRYTIPVFDTDGKVVNVRRYDPSKTTAKIIHYTEKKSGETIKYGRPARLYGVDELVKAENGARVHVAEGEWDRLVLAQQGWIAVTGTHGCKTWLAEWNDHFKGKDVVLLYDNDRQGLLASARVGKALLPVAKRVRAVKLPVDVDGMKDVTDWFVAAGQTVEGLEKLIAATPAMTAEGEKQDDPEADEAALDFKVEKITTFDSVPKKYVLEIAPARGRRGEMEINGDTLINLAKFERAYLAYFNQVPLGMPHSHLRWKMLINVWLARSLVIEQPPEASELAALREVLADELRKMPISEGLAELDRAKAINTPGGERIFKAVAMRRILISEFGDVTKHTMCAALRRIGCESKVVKVDGRAVKVWTIPDKLQQEDKDELEN